MLEKSSDKAQWWLWNMLAVVVTTMLTTVLTKSDEEDWMVRQSLASHHWIPVETLEHASVDISVKDFATKTRPRLFDRYLLGAVISENLLYALDKQESLSEVFSHRFADKIQAIKLIQDGIIVLLSRSTAIIKFDQETREVSVKTQASPKLEDLQLIDIIDMKKGLVYIGINKEGSYSIPGFGDLSNLHLGYTYQTSYSVHTEEEGLIFTRHTETFTDVLLLGLQVRDYTEKHYRIWWERAMVTNPLSVTIPTSLETRPGYLDIYIQNCALLELDMYHEGQFRVKHDFGHKSVASHKFSERDDHWVFSLENGDVLDNDMIVTVGTRATRINHDPVKLSSRSEEERYVQDGGSGENSFKETKGKRVLTSFSSWSIFSFLNFSKPETRKQSDTLEVMKRAPFTKRVLAGCNFYFYACAGCDISGNYCTSCQGGFYLNTTTNSCITCTVYHAQCNGCSATMCYSCVAPWRPTPARDKCQCIEYAFLNGAVCTPCFKYCKTCNSTTTCQTCNLGFTLNANYTGCFPCTEACDTCASLTSCSICRTDYIPTNESPNNHCKFCDWGTYWMPDFTCAACDTRCSQCNHSALYCASCPVGQFFIPTTNLCITTTCPLGQWYDYPSNSCLTCDPALCKECGLSASGAGCEKCADGLWKDRVLSSTVCAASIPCNATRYRGIDNVCASYTNPYVVPARFTPALVVTPVVKHMTLAAGGKVGACGVNCASCLPYTTTDCTKCATNYAMIRDLPSGGFVCGNALTFTYGSISDAGALTGGGSYYCRHFNIETGKCHTCIINAVLNLAGACENACIATQYLYYYTGQCLPADNNCVARNGGNTCTACGNFSYYQASTASCVPCHYSCSVCTGPLATDCVQCAANYQKNNSLCSFLCDTPNYFDITTQSCLPSTSPCRTANNQPNECTSCLNNLHLTATGQCLDLYCPSGKYRDMGTNSCLPCHSTCLTCKGPTSTDCESCTFNLDAVTVPGSCIPFVCNVTGFCNGCHGPGITHCDDAVSGYYLDFNNLATKYYKLCDLGFYLDTSGNCVACDPSCIACTGAGVSKCSLCAEGYFSHYGKCTKNPNNCNIYGGQTIDFNNNQACIPCSDPNCNTCGLASQCKLCKNGYYPTTSGSCSPCSPNTIYCQQNSFGQSLQCKHGYFFGANTNCIKYCAHGTIPNANGDCTPCAAACETCYYSTSYCSTCLPGDQRYYQATTCEVFKNVTLGAYYVTGGGSVERCVTPCRTCQSDGTTCLTCIPGYFMNPITSTCQICSDRCYTCSTTATNCDSCLIGYTWSNITKDCTPICEFYEYFDTTINHCNLCPFPCVFCNNANPSECLTCQAGYYLTGTKCERCFDTCMNCTGPLSTDCTVCYPGYVKDPSGKCILTCPSGTYFHNSRYECVKCPKYCQECMGNTPYNCTVCKAGHTFVANTYTPDFGNQTTGFCKRTCKTNELFIGRPFPNECKPCSPQCATCSGLTQDACLTCSTGYYFDTNRCLKCHPFCQNCTGPSPFDCITCNSPAVLDTAMGYCRSSPCIASAGQILNFESNLCVNCYIACGTCSNITQTDCLTCSPSYPLMMHNNSCIATCGSGRYYDPIVKDCFPCHSSCKECIGPLDTNCTECPLPGYYVQVEGYCAAGCKVKSYISPLDPFKCVACYPDCFTCNGTSITECLTCQKPRSLQPDNSCKIECPFGYYLDDVGNACAPCHSFCRTCTGYGLTLCLSCYSDRTLRTDGICAKNCAKGYYYIFSKDICEVCHPDCQECISGSAKDCSICANNKLLSLAADCVSVCPVGQYQFDSLKCAECHYSCENCNGPTANSCTSCQSPMVLRQNGQCATSCLFGEFTNPIRECKDCYPTCLSCTSPDPLTCIQCKDTWKIRKAIDGRCIDCYATPDDDQYLCSFVVPLTLSKASSEQINPRASLTLRISFPSEDQYISSITPSILTRCLGASVTGFREGSDYTYTFAIRNGMAFIDVLFTVVTSDDVEVVLPIKDQTVLTNQLTNATKLGFQNKPPKYSTKAQEAPNSAILELMDGPIESSKSVSTLTTVLGSIASLVATLAGSGLGAPLMRFLRVFKMVSRLRLINLQFGAYLETFLSFCNAIFLLGGDPVDKEDLLSAPDTRGKLTKYKISALSVRVLTWQYSVYMIALLLRLYRMKIRTYANNISRLTRTDQLINMATESLRIVLPTLVGIDLFFYSMHAAVHIQKNSSLSPSAINSLWLSNILLILIPFDLMLLYFENKDCTFQAVITENNLKEYAKRRLEEEKKNPGDKNKSIKEFGSALDSSRNEKYDDKGALLVYVDLDKASREARRKKLGLKTDIVGNPVAEKFFSGGLKVDVVTGGNTRAKYLNAMALWKTFMFEPIYVGLQMYPGWQVGLLFVIQSSYLVWLFSAVWKSRAFQNKITMLGMLMNELSLLIFIGVGFGFHFGGGSDGYSPSTSKAMQFTGMAAVGIACFIGAVDLIGNLCLAPKTFLANRKINKMVKEIKKQREEGQTAKRIIYGRGPMKDSLPGTTTPIRQLAAKTMTISPPSDQNADQSRADLNPQSGLLSMDISMRSPNRSPIHLEQDGLPSSPLSPSKVRLFGEHRRGLIQKRQTARLTQIHRLE